MALKRTFISVSRWASQCGISRQAAHKRIRSLGIPRGLNGGIDPAVANRMVAERLDPRQQRPRAGGAATEPPEALNEARLRRESAKADSARVQADLALVAVVRVDDVLRVWGALISPAKTRLMSLGARVGPLVAIESDASACQAMIDAAVYEALSEIAEYGRNYDL